MAFFYWSLLLFDSILFNVTWYVCPAFSLGDFLPIYGINRMKDDYLKSHWTAAFSTFKSHRITPELIANVGDASRYRTNPELFPQASLEWKQSWPEASVGTYLGFTGEEVMFVRPWLQRCSTRRNNVAAVLSDTRERRSYSSWLTSGNPPGGVPRSFWLVHTLMGGVWGRASVDSKQTMQLSVISWTHCQLLIV